MIALLYPDDWPAIAFAVKEANHFICQECNRQCRRPGEFYLGWQYELTVAHLDSDYEAAVINVAALCASCHLRYDAPFVWIARRRHQRLRRRLAGQLMWI